MRRNIVRQRRGVALVEAAFIFPLAFLLVLGLMVLASGVFRYQQVAHISREAARWASVKGKWYSDENNKAMITKEDVYNEVIAPRSAGLNLSCLEYSVTWDVDQSPVHTEYINGAPTDVANTVTVVLTYNWKPEAYGISTFAPVSPWFDELLTEPMCAAASLRGI